MFNLIRENIENDLINNVTKRPNSSLLKKSGSYFIRIKLDDFGYKITLFNYVSPDNLISLFTLYCTSELAKKIV
jgi:hypothetical protein